MAQSASARAILIAIEGIDGAGKTTQASLLRNALEGAGLEVVSSKEPTDGRWGKIIKESATVGRMSLDDELAAFINDRTEHVDRLIAPSLDAGKVVILDRYFYSTIAYQGCRGADVQAIQKAMEDRFPIPDAVFLLDIDPLVGVHRIATLRKEEPNHFEERGNLAKAREIFNALADRRIHRMDGSMSREAVHTAIMERLVEGALKAKRCAKQYGCEDPFHCSFRMAGACAWFKLQSVLRPQSP